VSASRSGGGPLSPDMLGEVLGRALRRPGERDRVFPKNKKVEIVFLVEAVNAILPRTEGVEDITLIKLPGTEYEVPMILPEKLQAVARRRMLAQLRRFRDERPQSLKRYLETLSALYKFKKGGKKAQELIVGFTRAQQYREAPESWNCFIQPPGGDKREATDVGMDGFCPACALFGTVIDGSKLDNIDNESIGVKSRVEFDPAIAFVDQEKSVAGFTHNKVADGVSWTGQGLYTEHHVVPGMVFVGKVTLEDVTESELKSFLAVLAAIDRLGGRERLFGGVRIHLIGIRGGSHETVSALELARELAKMLGEREYPPSADEIVKKVYDIIGEYGFHKISSSDYRKLLDDMDVWGSLWRDTVDYDCSVVGRVLSLLKNNYEKLCQ